MRPSGVCAETEHLGGLNEWPTLCPVGATPEERQVRIDLTRLRRLEIQTKAAREDVAASIVAALDAGTKQVQLVRITGYTREHIRRLARKDDATDTEEAARAWRLASPGTRSNPT